MTQEIYEKFIDLVTNKIDVIIKKELKDWICPDFSTTTKMDILNSQVVFMNTMKSFFTYYCKFKCGLSEVIMEGTEEDWSKLIEKIKKLKDFDDENLNEWSDTLVYVLEEFVNFKKGKVNEDFWQRICSYKHGGSDTPSHGGWFTVFNAFDSDGKYLLEPLKTIKENGKFALIKESKFSKCEVLVPIIVVNPDGEEFNVTLFSGIPYSQYDEDNKCIQPVSEFAIIWDK
jgi:hypothetical protein